MHLLNPTPQVNINSRECSWQSVRVQQILPQVLYMQLCMTQLTVLSFSHLPSHLRTLHMVHHTNTPDSLPGCYLTSVTSLLQGVHIMYIYNVGYMIYVAFSS